MTDAAIGDEHELAANELATLTPNGFANLFVRGFRAYALGKPEQAAAAFGSAYAYLFKGEDITADLASTYHILAGRAAEHPAFHADRAFIEGLLAAFDRLNILSRTDQIALKLLLRLAAKVQCIEILGLLPRKVFSPRIPPSDGLSELRHIAFEAVLALTYGNGEAGPHLRDIALTKSFDAENVDDLLIALCFAEPGNLLNHLIVLEDALVEIYGAADTTVNDDLRSRRILLLTDIGGSGYLKPTVLGNVVDLALTADDWRLSWIGRTLVEPLAEALDEEERDKAEQLIESLRKNLSKPARIPEGVRLSQPVAPAVIELREAFDALSSAVRDEQVEEEFFTHIVGSLGGVARLAGSGGPASPAS